MCRFSGPGRSLAANPAPTGPYPIARFFSMSLSIDDIHRLLMTVPTDQGFELTILRGDLLETVHVPGTGA